MFSCRDNGRFEINGSCYLGFRVSGLKGLGFGCVRFRFRVPRNRMIFLVAACKE